MAAASTTTAMQQMRMAVAAAAVVAVAGGVVVVVVMMPADLRHDVPCRIFASLPLDNRDRRVDREVCPEAQLDLFVPSFKPFLYAPREARESDLAVGAEAEVWRRRWCCGGGGSGGFTSINQRVEVVRLYVKNAWSAQSLGISLECGIHLERGWLSETIVRMSR